MLTMNQSETWLQQMGKMKKNIYAPSICGLNRQNFLLQTVPEDLVVTNR